MRFLAEADPRSAVVGLSEPCADLLFEPRLSRDQTIRRGQRFNAASTARQRRGRIRKPPSVTPFRPSWARRCA